MLCYLPAGRQEIAIRFEKVNSAYIEQGFCGILYVVNNGGRLLKIMKRNPDKEYSNKIIANLYNFQLIEEALKWYIEVAIKIIKEKLKGIIPYKYSRACINSDSIGKLIEKFSKLNNNQGLIGELKGVIKHRNDLAHRGLLITQDEWNDIFQINLQVAQLKKLRSTTRLLLSQLIKEANKIGDE